MPFTKTDNSALTEAEVRTIQSNLIRHGINPGPVDGIFGPRTGAAVIAFKRRLGYMPRPYVGPLTWAALGAEVGQADPGPAELVSDQPWIKIVIGMVGLHEVSDNRRLRDFLASDGHALGDPAVFPWCGDLVETATRLALPDEPFPGDLGVNPYWALNWRQFGVPCGLLPGCYASITRNGGGHVCWPIAEDATRLYCLGGNQANTISIAPIDKNRFEPASFRWPSTAPLPSDRRLPRMSSLQEAVSAFG